MMDNRHLICFIDGISDEARFDRFLEQFKRDGWQIHLLAGVNENALMPHQVPFMVDNLFPEGADGLVLAALSNMSDLLALIVRLFPNLFRRAILYSGEIAAYQVELDPVYRCLLVRELDEAEGMIGPVYISDSTSVDLLPGWLTAFANPLEDMPSVNEDDSLTREGTVVYGFESVFYRFEPKAGAAVRIVNLAGDPAPYQPNSFNTMVCGKQWIDPETVYMLKWLDTTKNHFIEHYGEMNRHFDGLAARLSGERAIARAFLEISLELAADSVHGYGRAFMLSFLMQNCPKAYYHELLLDLMLQDGKWSWEERLFYLWQCARVGFVRPSANSARTELAIRQLYRLVYGEIKDRFKFNFSPIPKQERNSDLVIVITGQFLNMAHAPTKTALDRCYTLIKHLGKKVILVNTRDVLTKVGLSPFYKMAGGSVIEEWSKVDALNYKDIQIPFVQSDIEMPNPDMIRGILHFVQRLKPEFVVGIGGMNLTADLCDMMVPVVTISLGFSGLPVAESRFQVIGRPVAENELDMLHKLGYSRENVIESLFTFDFKHQERKLTREQLGLPENRFLVAVVGARLDLEVTDEFINAVLDSHPSVHLVFIGPMSRYEEMKSRNERLAQASTALGFQDDVLAVLEVCDLYANPKRTGGGSSAAESLYKGLPVVTLNSGDVAVSAGPDFVVESYEEMTATIRRYVEDKSFYAAMSAKGKERAARLLSTDTEFAKIVNTIQSSPLF